MLTLLKALSYQTFECFYISAKLVAAYTLAMDHFGEEGFKRDRGKKRETAAFSKTVSYIEKTETER